MVAIADYWSPYQVVLWVLTRDAEIVQSVGKTYTFLGREENNAFDQLRDADLEVWERSKENSNHLLPSADSRLNAVLAKAYCLDDLLSQAADRSRAQQQCRSKQVISVFRTDMPPLARFVDVQANLPTGALVHLFDAAAWLIGSSGRTRIFLSENALWEHAYKRIFDLAAMDVVTVVGTEASPPNRKILSAEIFGDVQFIPFAARTQKIDHRITVRCGGQTSDAGFGDVLTIGDDIFHRVMVERTALERAFLVDQSTSPTVMSKSARQSKTSMALELIALSRFRDRELPMGVSERRDLLKELGIDTLAPGTLTKIFKAHKANLQSRKPTS